ncbi:hypothetical protein BGZ70_008381 [Mortierella alpina]|uniref:VLRF1 domain-containing protein n=1 Tax=Mortierella alpina TaxID=64518 RepID=A0A9P6J3J7_MORAP|nr:hypothetical protein BGZ70_008381 [Mortierella alpina]
MDSLHTEDASHPKQDSSRSPLTLPSATKTTPLAPPAAPLSVFLLPPELVSTLVPQDQAAAPALVESPMQHRRGREGLEPAVAVSSLDSATASCRICGIAQFENVSRQREHVKLDWHRYNLKQQLLDKRAQPISEQQFENMVQDLSSISGSDDEDDGDDDEDGPQRRPHRTAASTPETTAVNSVRGADTPVFGSDDQEALIQSLIKKLELTTRENQKARNLDPVLVHKQQQLEQQLQEARMSPMIWFTSTLYDETVRLGIYKNALPNKGQCDDLVTYLQSLQFPVEPKVRKQKNNRARREARRAAAAAAATAADADASSEQTPHSQQKPQGTELEPSGDKRSGPGKDDSSTHEDGDDDEDEDDEEENDVVEPEQDWIKYQMMAKQQPTTAVVDATKPAIQARYWTMIMIGGGHFAGLVIDLAGQVSTHGRDMKVIAHKTFHRYTVRKKQGGSQSTHGVANSAGARIRMYNEEALKLEVRELLEGWSHWIKQSECVFVHAPGNNRRVLFYDDSALSAADHQGRLRSIPFMTRRPTLSELKRAFQELTTVKVSLLTKDALHRKEQQEQEALEKAMAASDALAVKEQDPAKIQVEKSAPEAPAELLKLIELVKKGRVEAMSSHLLKHGIDASQLLPLTSSTEYDIRRTPTLLHLASHHGQALIVKQLLEKHHADPTTTTVSAMANEAASEDRMALMGAGSFTAYDIAKDKETRNAFRRAMAKLPDAWDWVGLAHIPSALTPEMEAEQERKAKEKTRKLLEAERERKKTRESSRPGTPTGTSNSHGSSALPSGSSAPSVVGKNMASASAANSHLSPEMRMRLERERRANAAEARMAAMRQAEGTRRAVQEGKNVCVACGKSLEGLTPFEKFNRKFCTTACVAKGPA